MQEIINVISYNLMVLIMQKRHGLDHASGASEKCFEFTSSITLESVLLASTKKITLIIALVLLAFEPHTFHRIDNGTRGKNYDFNIC